MLLSLLCFSPSCIHSSDAALKHSLTSNVRTRRSSQSSAHTESTHFEQIDLTVRVVVVLEAVKGVVVSVAVDGAHSWTR